MTLFHSRSARRLLFVGATFIAAGSLPAGFAPSAWAQPAATEQPPATQPDGQQMQRVRPNPNAGFLGARFGPIDDDTAARLKLDSQAGLLVIELVPSSPAEEAGLKPDDVIKTIDGNPVEDARGFVAMMSQTKPGQVLKIAIVRENKPMDVSVTLGTRPADMNRMERGPATAPTTRPGN